MENKVWDCLVSSLRPVSAHRCDRFGPTVEKRANIFKWTCTVKVTARLTEGKKKINEMEARGPRRLLQPRPRSSIREKYSSTRQLNVVTVFLTTAQVKNRALYAWEEEWERESEGKIEREKIRLKKSAWERERPCKRKRGQMSVCKWDIKRRKEEDKVRESQRYRNKDQKKERGNMNVMERELKREQTYEGQWAKKKWCQRK